MAGSTTLAATAIQIDVKQLLNCRTVITLTEGNLVPCNGAVDGNGVLGGWSLLATDSASIRMKTGRLQALPNDGRFAANGDHPEVILHFSNADGKGNQIRKMPANESVQFEVPVHAYKRFFLFGTSSNGASNLAVTLSYQDGTSETRSVTVPDWWPEKPPSGGFSLMNNLAKWGSGFGALEEDRHRVDGFELRPNEGKKLIGVKIAKTGQVFAFWGATGETSEPTTALLGRGPELSEPLSKRIGIPSPRLPGIMILQSHGMGNVEFIDLSGRGISFPILHSATGAP
jgi:hypothetical protein